MSQGTTPSTKACSPAPITTTDGASSGGQNAVMSKLLWPFTKDADEQNVALTYYFLDGTPHQKDAVTNTIETWMTYANVSFDKISQRDKAQLRISFSDKGSSWSMVGVDANTVKDKSKPTMMLGWLADAYPPSASDASTILHEFGHALGMMHEHQSPARGGSIHLKDFSVYQYYRPLLNYDDALVKSQVIDQYNLASVSNFSRLDLKSIMMYFMPADLNQEGIEVPPNLVLSELDKAFITLNYPRSTPAEGGMSVAQALDIAGVSDDAAADILNLVDKGDYQGARDAFSAYNMSVMQMSAVNGTFLKAINPTNQFGILDTIGKVVDNPMFKSIVKNVINQVFVQRALPTATSIPGSDEKNVLDTIGSMITNPAFASAIHDITSELAGFPDESAPTDGDGN